MTVIDIIRILVVAIITTGTLILFYQIQMYMKNERIKTK